MDPDKDIAEERLLRVIEKGQSRSASVAVGAGRGFNPFQMLRLWFAKSYSRPVGREEDALLSGLKVLTTLLWVALIGFGIYFVVGLFSPDKVLLQRRIFERGRAAADDTRVTAPDQIAGNMKPETHYTEALQNPNPFTGVSEELPQEIVEVEQGPSTKDKLAEMVKPLVVVGINRGPVPDAIIENTEQKRTFFVKVGDAINDLTVKEIKRDTVVLRYEAEQIEIG